MPARIRSSSVLFFLSHVLAVCAMAQPPGGGSSTRPVASIRYGGIDHNAPTRAPQRVVQGIVQDDKGKVVPRAQIYLRDEKTKSLRVIFADEQGKYLFGGLPLTHDYTVWVQSGTRISPSRPISSFVQTYDVTINLKLAAAPPAAAPKTTEVASDGK